MRKRNVLMLLLALVFLGACAHANHKPYTALDYAKVSLNEMNRTFQLAVKMVPDMRKFPDPKVQAAYPKALDILDKAGDALAAYQDAVHLWEVSGDRPSNITELKHAAQDLIDDIMDMLHKYHILK